MYIRQLSHMNHRDIDVMNIDEVEELMSLIREATNNNPEDGGWHLNGLYEDAKRRLKILVLQNPPKSLDVDLKDSRLEGLLDPPEMVHSTRR